MIEGGQETLYDAERIRATGSKVMQINTGAGFVSWTRRC